MLAKFLFVALDDEFRLIEVARLPRKKPADANFVPLAASFLLVFNGFYLLPQGNVAAGADVYGCANQVFMRGKILIVDDDPDQVDLVRVSLKEAGFAIWPTPVQTTLSRNSRWT